jgi:hypothetical protein
MVTKAQKQTVWAPRLQNLTEMLKPHVAEIKQQGESKLQHPEPLACGKLLHATLNWESRSAAAPADTGSKPAWETFVRPTGEHQESRGFPPSTPRINQHGPLGRLTPPTHKKPEQ